MKVAVLMSTFNGESYVSEQLDSLLQQSYTDFEIYIRDDGSSDETLNIINSYKDKYTEVKVMESTENLGCARSFLSLLNSVEADYYFFCDQDDVWYRNKIEDCLSEFEPTDGPHLVHCDLKIVDEELSTIENSFYRYQNMAPHIGYEKNRLVVQNYIVGCTMCFNKDLRDLVLHHYSDELNVAMHDWWIALVARFFGKVTYINEQLIDYRQHNNNVLGAANNSLSRYLKSFTSGMGVKRVQNFTEKVSAQASSFYDCYSTKLQKDDKRLFRHAIKFNTKLGVINLLKLMILENIRLQGLKRNFALIFTSIKR
ncbi:glycosyltransferase family 2 protein [Vibrio parahaemolyticus]|uniref:Putative glycosyltransferase EpsE n=1 Tax=Vibrio parahaemolyticus TaxID=670 RepID=A0A7M1VP06_VIBPH|nr:glycosyltransferase family 2 protein [Vibrio parahaemolyticus]EGR3263001.1 glycosyltransferase family 2 protein [Vibrio parahaemolyticus]EGX6076828.1 glycosyltransferase family 2 protein [Vibrio parahaemolyticus]EKG9562034.1 glycosyltransferase family 2 protein [Vibrio parahaemolyticus]EKG9661473.1 glycosyltransferase family 2 protein [Vibrio parahaemolyticus]EKG9667371.1 glycosyltransferase family 2 protein [Vibrio parahaemolyticus]